MSHMPASGEKHLLPVGSTRRAHLGPGLWGCQAQRGPSLRDRSPLLICEYWMRNRNPRAGSAPQVSVQTKLWDCCVSLESAHNLMKQSGNTPVPSVILYSHRRLNELISLTKTHSLCWILLLWGHSQGEKWRNRPEKWQTTERDLGEAKCYKRTGITWALEINWK